MIFMCVCLMCKFKIIYVYEKIVCTFFIKRSRSKNTFNKIILHNLDQLNFGTSFAKKTQLYSNTF